MLKLESGGATVPLITVISEGVAEHPDELHA